MTVNDWLHWIEREGLPHGREDSFKMRKNTLLAERVLIGVDQRALPLERLLDMAREIGMPALYAATLRQHHAAANMVFFGLERDGVREVRKVYLELWDSLRQHVRDTGSTQPALLNVGLKWEAASGAGTTAHCRADYLCHPLLSPAGAVGRMRGIYRQVPSPNALDLCTGLVRRAAARAPGASFLYVEVSEGRPDEALPRQSFDINLYKSGLLLANVRDDIERLGAHFAVPEDRVRALLDRTGPHPLGHLSGGCDRHGDEFATVYYEIAPLPDGAR